MSVSIVKCVFNVFSSIISKSGNSIQHKTQNDIDFSLLIIFAMVLIEYDMLLRVLSKFNQPT